MTVETAGVTPLAESSTSISASPTTPSLTPSSTWPLSFTPSLTNSTTTTTTAAAAAAAAATTASSNTSSPETSSAISYSTSATTDLGVSSVSHSSTAVSSTFSTPSSTLHPSSDHASKSGASGSRYSTGTLAGSIVGSFLAGLIIAFVAAFLLLRRRKKVSSSHEKSKDLTRETREPPEDSERDLRKSPNYVVSSRYEGAPDVWPNVGTLKSFNLSPYVRESADDNTVCMRIQTLFDQASLHIDNYYSRPDAALRPTQEDSVHILDFESPFLGTPLFSLLSKPRTQRAVLTHVLVHTLLQSIRPGDQARSILPACHRLDPKARESESLAPASDHEAFAWRMLTSHLYTRSHTAQSTNLAGHNENMMKLADDFSRAFAPYGDPRFPQADRLAHIHTVIRETSRIGIWLFSQPCSFDFHWSMVSKSNQITLFPSVVKVYDEYGRRLAVPQRLLDEVKAQI